MSFLYFHNFGPWLVKGLLGILFLKYLYIARELSKLANESMKARADTGFDKEAFYEKYRKIYESLPEEEKIAAKKRFEAEDSIVREVKTIAAPKARYTEEYNLFIAHKSPFDILSISSNASKAQIKKRYRTLAYQWHPDRFGSIQLSTEELRQVTHISQIINLAYEFLTSQP